MASQVKYPCKHRANGCTDVLSYDTVVGHHATCRYSLQVCPFAKLAIEDCTWIGNHCSWTGNYSDINGHLQENHASYCTEYEEGGMKLFFRTAHVNYPSRFLIAYNEIFYFSCLEKYKIFYFVVLYVGPAENAAKYKYKVEFVNEDNTVGVTVMHLTRSADENVDEICRSDNCGKLHYGYVKRFINEFSELCFKIEILKVGN
jgi:hypothetical protein